jgi:signal transduction histidine kinase
MELAEHERSDPERDLAALISESEFERARIARLLHDEIGPSLSAAGMQLEVLRLDLRARVPEIGARTAEIQAVLERVMERVRALSRELNPSLAERAGLRFALEHLVEQSCAHIACTLDFPSGVSVSRELASPLYRIAGYAMDVAVRSGASHAAILVRGSGDACVLEVLYDESSLKNLRALDAKARSSLLLLRYQAASAGVRLDIRSTSVTGTSIRAEHKLK